MLSISNGTFPMRSRNAIPHDRIKYYPDHLKSNGYYVGNSTKTDYNIGGRPDKECWDNPGKVKWEDLAKNQPFFQVVNLRESHESRAQGDVENTLHDPRNTTLRKYHPDLPDIRKNYAKYHDAMKRMDSDLGASLDSLKAMGLAENTIVVHNSDHGGVLPRSKRYLFSTGLHCPLIIRIPDRYKHLWPAQNPGTKIDRLVSFVDMPKTWLSLTGSTVPDYMHGTVFLGPQTEPEQEFHFSFRGRMDERLENARAVCDKQFLYIRNYMPYVPWMQKLEYLWKMKATQAWESHVASGNASEVQSRFFAPKRWTEELYDTQKDPDNIDNLSSNPKYAQVIEKMRNGLRQQQLKFHDSGLLPESEMVKRAADNQMTIHDMVRDPKQYNLPALLNAADLALDKNPANIPHYEKMLKQADCGMRYWGMVGCFQLDHDLIGNRHLQDDSHEVRAMAAWLLIRNGKKESGVQCLKNLLEQNSYAVVTVLNIIDWMGDDGRELMPVVESLTPAKKSYELRMQNNLMAKWPST